MLELSQDIGHRLRVHEFLARGVQIAVRDNTLFYKQYQAQLGFATRSPMEIARKAKELFEKNYSWRNQVRSVNVGAINLVPTSWPQQLTLFDDHALKTTGLN